MDPGSVGFVEALLNSAAEALRPAGLVEAAEALRPAGLVAAAGFDTEDPGSTGVVEELLSSAAEALRRVLVEAFAGGSGLVELRLRAEASFGGGFGCSPMPTVELRLVEAFGGGEVELRLRVWLFSNA